MASGNASLANRRRRMRIALAAGIAFALLAVAGVAAWLFGAGSFAYDPSSQAGQAPRKTPEEVQAELDRIVEEGMFNISIESVIEFPTPDGSGTAYIENVPGNRYDMQVSIVLDATETTLYESGIIAPGSYIESIQLSELLDPGEHGATATFTALDRETHEQAGQAAAKVRLVVAGT